MIPPTKENSEINTEIKVLSDEITAVRAHREKLKTSYLEEDQYYVDRETTLVNKRFALLQKKKTRE